MINGNGPASGSLQSPGGQTVTVDKKINETGFGVGVYDTSSMVTASVQAGAKDVTCTKTSGPNPVKPGPDDKTIEYDCSFPPGWGGTTGNTSGGAMYRNVTVKVYGSASAMGALNAPGTKQILFQKMPFVTAIKTAKYEASLSVETMVQPMEKLAKCFLISPGGHVAGPSKDDQTIEYMCNK